MWGFNQRSEPFDDVLVRRTLSHAVDKDIVRDAVFYGFGDDIVGPISPRSWAYYPDAEGYDYDPTKAAEMLDAAGYPMGDDGVRFEIMITHQGDYQSLCRDFGGSCGEF